MKFNSEIKIQYNDICKILAEYFGVNEENVELNVTDPIPPFEIEAKIIKEVEAPAKTIDNLRCVPYDPPINPNLFNPNLFNPWNPVIYDSSVAKDISNTSIKQVDEINKLYVEAVDKLTNFCAKNGEGYLVRKEDLDKLINYGTTKGETNNNE